MSKFLNRSFKVTKAIFQHPLEDSFLVRSSENISFQSYMGKKKTSGESSNSEARTTEQDMERLKYTTVSARFKLVFFVVLALTLVFLALAVLIAFSTNEALSDPKQKLFDTSLNACFTGFGAMVGLISGKTIE